MRLLALIVLAGSTALAQAPMMYYQAAPVVGGTGARTAVVQRGMSSLAAADQITYVDLNDFDSTKTWVTVHAATDSINLEDMRYTVDVINGDSIVVERGDDTGGNFPFTYSAVTDPGLTVARYRGTMTAGQDTLAVTISSVNTAKTWIYPTFRQNVDGAWVVESSASWELESATSLKLRRQSSSYALNYVIQVVTYDSCSVQRGYTVSPGSGATKDLAITALTDSAKAFAVISLHSTLSGGNSMNDWGWYASWYSNDATIDTLRLIRYDNYSSYRIYYEVVEFTDASSVKGIFFGETTADQTDVTVAAADTTYASFLGAGPEARHAAINNGTSSRSRAMWTYRFNNSTTQVRMTRYGDTLGSKGKAYILEWKGVN